jgi:hypothetical protein
LLACWWITSTTTIRHHRHQFRHFTVVTNSDRTTADNFQFQQHFIVRIIRSKRAEINCRDRHRKNQ